MMCRLNSDLARNFDSQFQCLNGFKCKLSYLHGFQLQTFAIVRKEPQTQTKKEVCSSQRSRRFQIGKESSKINQVVSQ